MIEEMPPQAKMIYETMVKPKLREMNIAQLSALREFIVAEVSGLITEHEQHRDEVAPPDGA